MKTIIFKITVIFLFVLLLSACNVLETRLYKKSPEFIEVVNKDELNDAGYMGRYLMDADERLVLEANIRREELKRRADYSPVGFNLVGTTLMGNNPLSSQGVNTAGNILLGVDATLQVLDILRPDGDLDMVSKIYVPDKLNDFSLTTLEDATAFVRSYTRKRVELFAQKENRSVECIYGCDSSKVIYKLIKNGFIGNEPYDATRRGTEIADGEYYDPPVLYVITIGAELMASKSDPVRDRILGFTPVWESKLENGWHSYLAGDIIRNENGDIKLTENKDLGMIPAGWMYGTETSPVSRRFLRILTGGDNLIYRGRRNIYINQFAMKGKVFEFYTSRRADRFMEFEIDPNTDNISETVSLSD